MTRTMAMPPCTDRPCQQPHFWQPHSPRILCGSSVHCRSDFHFFQASLRALVALLSSYCVLLGQPRTLGVTACSAATRFVHPHVLWQPHILGAAALVVNSLVRNHNSCHLSSLAPCFVCHSFDAIETISIPF